MCSSLPRPRDRKDTACPVVGRGVRSWGDRRMKVSEWKV